MELLPVELASHFQRQSNRSNMNVAPHLQNWMLKVANTDFAGTSKSFAG
jgi:hypothetical protein